MDFSRIGRPSFSAPPRSAAIVPAPHRGRQLRRRQVMFREASELLPHLPLAEGEATHCLFSGRADLMVLVAAMLDHYGLTCPILRLATLAFNERTVSELSHLLVSGKVAAITLLASKFFKAHNPDIYSRAKELAEEHAGRWRLAASRNHSKLACIDLGSCKLAVESSANLRCNGNVEQVAVTMDTGLHDFYARWIDQTVAAHDDEDESDGRGDRETG